MCVIAVEVLEMVVSSWMFCLHVIQEYKWLLSTHTHTHTHTHTLARLFCIAHEWPLFAFAKRQVSITAIMWLLNIEHYTKGTWTLQHYSIGPWILLQHYSMENTILWPPSPESSFWLLVVEDLRVGSCLLFNWHTRDASHVFTHQSRRDERVLCALSSRKGVYWRLHLAPHQPSCHRLLVGRQQVGLLRNLTCAVLTDAILLWRRGSRQQASWNRNSSSCRARNRSSWKWMN